MVLVGGELNEKIGALQALAHGVPAKPKVRPGDTGLARPIKPSHLHGEIRILCRQKSDHSQRTLGMTHKRRALVAFTKAELLEIGGSLESRWPPA